MDLNQHKGKILIGGGALALLVVVLLTALTTAYVLAPGGGARNNAGGPPPEKTPAEALAECDRLASTPGDPARTTAPVSDEQFAPVAAVAACKEAVNKNSGSMRANFQLGRSLWLSKRDAEAYEQFRIALRGGYAAAFKYMGDAYRDGRLPPGETANLPTAIALYRKAADGGFAGADIAQIDAQKQLDSMVFDKTLFQNGDYMEMIYNNDYSKLDFPLALVYYMQGVAAGLEDNNVVFMDQSCKELTSKAGLDALQVAEPAVLIIAIFGSTDKKGQWTPEGLIKALLSGLVKDYLFDQGKRDATVLYNPDQRYGCKSDVTRQILSHMMLVIKNTTK